MSQIIINGQPLYQVDLPEMTLAQWLALPVAERPKEWIRTDAEYTDIPAENVSYDGGSVKDALDASNANITLLTDWEANTDSAFVVKKNGHFVDVMISVNRPNNQTLPTGWTKFAILDDAPPQTITYVATVFGSGNSYNTTLRGTVTDLGEMFVFCPNNLSNVVRIVCNFRYFVG